MFTCTHTHSWTHKTHPSIHVSHFKDKKPTHLNRRERHRDKDIPRYHYLEKNTHNLRRQTAASVHHMVKTDRC